MELLSDFLKCFCYEHISCSDVLKRLNFYYQDYDPDDKKGYKYLPFDYVGFTRVFSDSPEYSKLVYLFRNRGAYKFCLINYDFSQLLKSSSLYCRPKRAWRDWFNYSLLPF